MKDGDVLLFLVLGFSAISALIFLVCRLLKTKESRKWKRVDQKPDSNGGTELTEVVSKDVKEVGSAPNPPNAPSAPQEGTEENAEKREQKKRKSRKALPGEDFYAGKTELYDHHHSSSEEDKEDGLEEALFGKEEEDESPRFF